MSHQEQTSAPRLLNEVEVSALAGIPKMTLRSHRHLRRGLPYVRIGHLVRYDDEIEKFLDERTVLARTSPDPKTKTIRQTPEAKSGAAGRNQQPRGYAAGVRTMVSFLPQSAPPASRTVTTQVQNAK